MKKLPLLAKIGLVLAAALAALCAFIATRPATFHVERSTIVAAPPALLFARVNDFHRWNEWSPYDKLDPNLKRTFSGAPQGPGAVYAWSGNGQAGEGSMTIEEAVPPHKLTIPLTFTKPFAAKNTAVFSFTEVPEGTKVTWGMDGQNNFVSKAFGLVMDMDKLVGGDFEKGLAAMKIAAEAEAKGTHAKQQP